MNLATGLDLDHPMVAPWLVRVWAALDSSGEPLLHAGDQGFRSHTPLVFDTPDEAAMHGVPVLLDLWGGLPVRLVASLPHLASPSAPPRWADPSGLARAFESRCAE